MANEGYINDVLQSILDHVCECLEGTVAGRPKDCFLSFTRPPDDCCFAAETEIETPDGLVSIGELAGTTCTVLSADGEWIDAPIRSFGTQELRRITLWRDGAMKTIYATPNHRWLVDDRSDVSSTRTLIDRVTDDLFPGDVLAAVGSDSERRWEIASVDHTDRVEEVFCASVPGTRSFALADDILTGNCDYVSAWFTRILPTRTFPDVYDGVDNCGDVGRMMEAKIKLVRPCWPVVHDNPNNPFPLPSEIQDAAEILTVDANVLWCCLANGFTNDLSLLGYDGGCLDTRIDSVEADEPRGGCAGVTATLMIELDGCCADEFGGSS